jgi:hypothetical protein
MTQKNNRAQIQMIYRAHDLHGKQEPLYMKLALAAINEWGREERTLAHAVAVAIQTAYEAGKAGKTLIAPVFEEPEIPEEEEIEVAVPEKPARLPNGRAPIRINVPQPPQRPRVQVRRRV